MKQVRSGETERNKENRQNEAAVKEIKHKAARAQGGRDRGQGWVSYCARTA